MSAAQMRAAEEAAFARGCTAESLMDQAGAGIAKVVRQFCRRPGRCLVFAGKGNNAGDALVAGEHLLRDGWQIELRLVFPEQDCGELMRKKLASFRASARGDVLPHFPGHAEASPSGTIILDGILGLGAKPPLRGPVRDACRGMNQLRRDCGAKLFAIDLPTGLEGDSGKADRDCVVADVTITIGFAKKGLVADGALNLVGRLAVVDLPDLRGRAEARPSEMAATAASLRGVLPRRSYDAYKNQFGRAGIVAGSKGFTGAALMCTLGALRAGAGLVEVFVPEEVYEIVAAAAPPESMVRPVRSYEELLGEKIDVWGIGPGLGQKRAAEISKLVEAVRQPMVVDADALNVVSKQMKLLSRCRGPRLLTPHPGEMKRLFGSRKETRAQTAKRFCAKYPVALLFKGSRTIVAEQSRPLSYNTTGNPGMATGGMGDILTGVCTALIGQKLKPYDAGRLGAWLCGRAAELAISHGGASEQSLLPRDVLDHLGSAFRELQEVAQAVA